MAGRCMYAVVKSHGMQAGRRQVQQNPATRVKVKCVQVRGCAAGKPVCCRYEGRCSGTRQVSPAVKTPCVVGHGRVPVQWQAAAGV